MAGESENRDLLHIVRSGLDAIGSPGGSHTLDPLGTAATRIAFCIRICRAVIQDLIKAQAEREAVIRALGETYQPPNIGPMARVPQDRIKTLAGGYHISIEFLEDARTIVKPIIAKAWADELVGKVFEYGKVREVPHPLGGWHFSVDLEVIVPPTPGYRYGQTTP